MILQELLISCSCQLCLDKCMYMYYPSLKYGDCIVCPPPQPLNDIDHHTINLEPVKFSFDEDVNNPPLPNKQDRRTASLLSQESSEDEFFDADDSLVGHERQNDTSTSTASGGALGLAPPPRSISVTTIEGDPPDVEEDRDFTEIEELPGEIFPSCICMISVESFVRMTTQCMALPGKDDKVRCLRQCRVLGIMCLLNCVL